MITPIQTDENKDFILNKKIVLFKKFFVLFVILFVCSLVIISLYFLAEKYYFDKLFHQKSLLHGYYSFFPNKVDDWQTIAKEFNKDQRNTDLLNLVFAGQGDQEAIDYFSKERENHDFKVAMIGDSMFFGLGVRKSQTIAYYLYKLLKTHNNNVKIYNYSFSGDDILDNYIKYELVQKYLKPDLILLGLVDNDLIFDNIERYPGKYELNARLEEVCYDKVLVKWEMEDRIRNDPDFNQSVFLSSFASNSQNFCFLTQISENFNKENLILIPFNYTNAPYFDTECLGEEQQSYCMYKQIFKKYLTTFSMSIPILDLYNLDVQAISEWEQHFNKSTNFRLAERIANHIIENYTMFQ